MTQPYLLGISGPSGSGKTSLAQCLARRMPGEPPLIPLDAYYRDLSHLSPDTRAKTNFDEPASLDEALLTTQLQALANGEAIDMPVYDFTTHTRASDTVHIVPKTYVIIEGLFTFCFGSVRDLLNARIFLTAEPQVCLERRTARDVVERGRTPASVEEQFRTFTYPMFLEHVWPSRLHADLVLHSAGSPESMAESVLAWLRRKGLPL